MPPRQRKISAIVENLLDWFAVHARDLPWRRTRDPYAIWVSEIMLQQTQVKTVIPYWERWLRALPTLAAAARARPERLHKLWEGLGYYRRVRHLQQAAQAILTRHGGRFPERLEDVLALPGVGRYTAGAICSIAFNQPTPILDGNVIRVLARLFGLAGNPRDKAVNAKLWQLAAALVADAQTLEQRETAAARRESCSHLNQSLMELGALICTPRQPQCPACPVRSLCVAFRERRVAELPHSGPRESVIDQRVAAFVLERDGKFLIRRRPTGGVNAGLWEFPNVLLTGRMTIAQAARKALGKIDPEGRVPRVPIIQVPIILPAQKTSDRAGDGWVKLCTVKHSITRHRITLEAWRGRWPQAGENFPIEQTGCWRTPAQMRRLAFAAAHKKILTALAAD